MTIRFWLPIRNEYIQHLMLKSRFPVKVIFFPTSQRTKKGFSKWHYKNTTSTAQNRSGIPEKIAPKIWFVHCPGSLSFAIFLRLKTSYTLLRAHFNIVRELGSKKTWNGKITFAKILCMQLFFAYMRSWRRLVHERKVKSFTLLNRICNVIPTYTD